MTETSSATTLMFPHPILTPILGKPTCSTLKKLKKQIYANARAVHSTRGGGTNGHLSCVMTPAEYLARANIIFNAPAHPGTAPVHLDTTSECQIFSKPLSSWLFPRNPSRICCLISENLTYVCNKSDVAAKLWHFVPILCVYSR